MNRAILSSAITLACCVPAAAATHTVTTIGRISVDLYAWKDSAGLKRTVALKREGEGNPGHGGYAIRMTYIADGKTVVVNAEPNDGFGYFVSHELYRDFTDGANDTIAHKIFRKDDSPLGRGFPVTGKTIATGEATLVAHQFKMNYPRYGTKAALAPDKKAPTTQASFALYQLPVTIIWSFEDGKDYPRIQYRVSLAGVPGPDRVSFDVRGPYGVMRFDNGLNANVRQVIWGDRFHFWTLGAPVTRGSGWIWSGANRGARYHALIAGGYEMGLFEPMPFRRSALADGYADARGKRSSTFNGGNGCPDPSLDQLLPCDWEWPYQSLQYSLSYENRNEPTNYKKMAWGSSPYYGTSLTSAFDTATTSEPLRGFPASRSINYSICIVLGLTIPQGLTRAAAAGPTYSCASAP